jgi:membrane associated rhomboid family serine protease
MMTLRLTPAVKILLVACFSMFLVQHTADRFFDGNVLGQLGLSPVGVLIQHKAWQLFTYPFLHGDVMHLFLNMLMLVFLGGEVEALWGTARFLRFYFFCSTIAGFAYLALQMAVGGGILNTPMVGASGALYGLLMAYGLLFGERVLLFMMIFPMKAKVFVWILALLELMTTVFSPQGGMASVAHLAGMAAGGGLLWFKALWATRQDRKPALFSRRFKKSSHLKLVINNQKKVELRPGKSKSAWGDDDENPPTFH